MSATAINESKTKRIYKETIYRQFNRIVTWHPIDTRSGKTTALILKYYLFLNTTPDTNHLILAFNQEMSYKLIIEGEGFGLLYLFPGSRIRANELGYHLELKSLTGLKRIYYKSGSKANDEGRFRGSSYGSVIFCEWDLLNIETIKEAYRRTIASKLRVHFADQNPCSPYHRLYSEIIPTLPNLYKTQWYMTDNPVLSKERIEQITKSLEANKFLYQRDVLGLDILPQGLIYSNFNDDLKIDNIPFKSNDIVELFFAADGGISHASSIHCFIVTKTAIKRDFGFYSYRYTLYDVGEYYYSGLHSGNKPLSIIAKEMKNFIDYMTQKYNHFYSYIYYDPAALVLGEELRNLKLNVQKADNNKSTKISNQLGVKAGIQRIVNLFDEKGILFYDDEKYPHTPMYKEISLYSYDDKGDIIKINDDSLDALRYGINHYFTQYS